METAAGSKRVQKADEVIHGDKKGWQQARKPSTLQQLSRARIAGERDGLAAELQESQKAGADLMQERDMLNSRLSAQETELETLSQQLQEIR